MVNHIKTQKEYKEKIKVLNAKTQARNKILRDMDLTEAQRKEAENIREEVINTLAEAQEKENNLQMTTAKSFARDTLMCAALSTLFTASFRHTGKLGSSNKLLKFTALPVMLLGVGANALVNKIQADKYEK